MYFSLPAYLFSAYRRFMSDKEWLASLSSYVHARHTSSVENFNSHTLLRYCPKRLSFSHDIYTMRYKKEKLWYLKQSMITYALKFHFYLSILAICECPATFTVNLCISCVFHVEIFNNKKME